MQIGIVGLPGSSKTTVFNALTGGHEATTGFGGAGFTLHRAMVDVPDPRVDRLAEIFKPKKVTYARVEYKDIGGLQKGIADGGLTGELLGAVAQNDALLHVVRAFEDEDLPHPEGKVDPRRDVAILDSEFLLSDQIVIERRLERLADQLKRPGKGPEHAANLAEQELLVRLHASLEAETPVRDVDLTAEEAKLIRGFQLLTAKPVLIALNTGEVDVADPSAILEYPHHRSAVVTIRGKIEMEIAQLDAEDRADWMAEYGVTELGQSRVIRTSYALLGLHSFLTAGEDEVRAWTIPIGATAVEAAGTIHSDLARGFIRAEVVPYDDLVAAGSLHEARRLGKVRLEGRDYVVHDGEIVHVRFNV